jgi:hypothetical protein
MSLVIKPCKNWLASDPATRTFARPVNSSATKPALLTEVVENSFAELKSGLRFRHRMKNILL